MQHQQQRQPYARSLYNVPPVNVAQSAHHNNMLVENPEYLVPFGSLAEAKHHIKQMKRHYRNFVKACQQNPDNPAYVASCFKCPSCGQQGTCGKKCILLNDGSYLNVIGRLRWWVAAFLYNFPAGVVAPIDADSQVLTQIDDQTVEVTNYNGVLPVPAAGMAQIVFPEGIILGPNVPAYALVAFSNILDAHSATGTANLLNTLWIVMPSTASQVWQLKKVNICNTNVGDVRVVKYYMDSTLTSPVPWIVKFTNVNQPEQTFTFEQTQYEELFSFIPLSVTHCAQEPKCQCVKSYDDEPCSGGNKCFQRRLGFSVVNPYAHPEIQQRNYPARRMSTMVRAGARGFAVHPKTGRLIAARGDRLLTDEEARRVNKTTEEAWLDMPVDLIADQYDQANLILDSIARRRESRTNMLIAQDKAIADAKIKAAQQAQKMAESVRIRRDTAELRRAQVLARLNIANSSTDSKQTPIPIVAAPAPATVGLAPAIQMPTPVASRSVLGFAIPTPSTETVTTPPSTGLLPITEWDAPAKTMQGNEASLDADCLSTATAVSLSALSGTTMKAKTQAVPMVTNGQASSSNANK